MTGLPDAVSDAIWAAAETAVLHGTQPQDFLRELRSAWEQAHDDKKKCDLSVFDRKVP